MRISLQELLARNDRTLWRSGLLIPKTCRIDRHSGHHNLAWELSKDARFNPRFGTLETLLTEIRTAGPRNVRVSTEDLELLHEEPHALALMRDGLMDAGYAPTVILYLRPQADYIESAYAELVKIRDLDFSHFFQSVLADGRYENLLFSYALAGRFAAVFGRAYESHCPSAFLLSAFLMTVAPAIASDARLTFPGRLNPMVKSCSRPLTPSDITRIEKAFRHANERLRSGYGVAIAHATAAIAERAWAAANQAPRPAMTTRGSLPPAERSAARLEAVDFTVQRAASN